MDTKVKVEGPAVTVTATKGKVISAPADVVVLPKGHKVADPTSAEVPQNKFVQSNLAEGYSLSTYRTAERDEAKGECAKLREQGFNATYATLHEGQFGVFFKVAPPKAVRISKVTRPTIPLKFKGQEFESTKQAREYARQLIDAARAAEFEADRAAAVAAKQAAKG